MRRAPNACSARYSTFEGVSMPSGTGLALHSPIAGRKDVRPKVILACCVSTWPGWSPTDRRRSHYSSAAASHASSRDSLRANSSCSSALSSPSRTWSDAASAIDSCSAAI